MTDKPDKWPTVHLSGSNIVNRETLLALAEYARNSERSISSAARFLITNGLKDRGYMRPKEDNE